MHRKWQKRQERNNTIRVTVSENNWLKKSGAEADPGAQTKTLTQAKDSKSTTTGSEMPVVQAIFLEDRGTKLENESNA